MQLQHKHEEAVKTSCCLAAAYADLRDAIDPDIVLYYK